MCFTHLIPAVVQKRFHISLAIDKFLQLNVVKLASINLTLTKQHYLWLSVRGI